MEIKLNRFSGPFSLEHTLNCGQLFRWKKLDDWWYGPVADNVIKIKHCEEKLIFQVAPETKNQVFIENYLRLNDKLSVIMAEINKDDYIQEAIKRFRGLRLCRQEPWECLISFICATYKNIPAIKGMISKISRRFGTKSTFDGHEFYTFPKPADILQGNIKELRKCGLGFRAERVLETAKIIENGELQLESLKNMDYLEAKHKLLDLPGVGNKVADCVLLFSLEKLEAFPIDVWMRRAATKLYASHFNSSFLKKIGNKSSITSKEYETISSFGRNYFGKYAGYAQEYLFHLMRTQQTV